MNEIGKKQPNNDMQTEATSDEKLDPPRIFADNIDDQGLWFRAMRNGRTNEAQKDFELREESEKESSKPPEKLDGEVETPEQTTNPESEVGPTKLDDKVEIPEQSIGYEDILITTKHGDEINLKVLVEKILKALQDPRLKSKGMADYSHIIQNEKEIKKWIEAEKYDSDLKKYILYFVNEIEEISKEMNIDLKQILETK